MDLFYNNCYKIVNPFQYGKSYNLNHRFRAIRIRFITCFGYEKPISRQKNRSPSLRSGERGKGVKVIRGKNQS